jgi:polar amino acid transport system substrate-binding protein
LRQIVLLFPEVDRGNMIDDRETKMPLLTMIPVICLVIVATMFLIIFWLVSGDTSLTRLQKSGIIRIGYAIEAPYAFLKPGGEVTGESPEVAKQIVARLGIHQVKWRLVEFDALISELEAGRIDVIAAGMFITPERAQYVNFSEPTFHVRQGLLVAKGNPRQIHSYQQVVTQTDIKIAVLAGAVEDGLLLRMGLSDRQRVAVPDALTGLVAVKSGLVDGLALSSPTIQWMALQDQLGQTEMAQPFEQPELAQQERLGYGAFAFRKTDLQLLSAWDTALKAFIGSPEHSKILSEFGLTEAELPGNITVQEIIAP